MASRSSAGGTDEDLTIEERKELNQKLGFEGTTVFGKLLKINAQHTEWSFRWCVHDGGRIMYYYDSKSDAIRRKNGTAIVLRSGVLRVGRSRVDAAKTRRNFSFLSIKAPPFNHVFSIDTSERQYKFCCRKEEEMLRWAQSLARVMDEKKVAEAHMARRELANIFLLEHERKLAEAERIAAASKAAKRKTGSGGTTPDGSDGEDDSDGETVAGSQHAAIKQIVQNHKLPQPPGNLVVYVRRIVDARLPEPASDDPAAKCVTMKLLMGMQKERCGTNNVTPERRPYREPAGPKAPAITAAGEEGTGAAAALTGAAAGGGGEAGGGAAAAEEPEQSNPDARYRVLFERAAVFVCPPNPSRVGSWEHSVRTTRVGHLQSIAQRARHRENAFRRKVGLESLEEQIERVKDGITLDDEDDDDEEEDEAEEGGGAGKGGASGAASGAGADAPASTAIVRRGRVRAKAIDATAAAIRRGPYGEMGVGAVPREFATMLRAARAAEAAAAEAAASAGASESKEGGESKSEGKAADGAELAADLQRLQQTAVAAAAAATTAAGEGRDEDEAAEDQLNEADFLHREADEMDDEEAGNSLQLLANLKLSLQIRRGMGRSSKVAYQAEVPLDKVMLKAHEPQRVVVSLPMPADDDATRPSHRSAPKGSGGKGGGADDDDTNPGEPGSLEPYDPEQHLLMPHKGKDLTDPANFKARKNGQPPRFCKDAELHLVLLWTDANVPALQKTVGYGDPQLRMAFPDLMRALDDPESRRRMRHSSKSGRRGSSSLYAAADSPLGRLSQNGDLQGFMSGTRLALVLRCAFAMADQERKDRRLFLRYASRALSKFGMDGLLVLGRKLSTLGGGSATDGSDDSESESDDEELDSDLGDLTPKSQAARALLAEASDSDLSDGGSASAPGAGNWSGLGGDSSAAIRGGSGGSSRKKRRRRRRRHRSRTDKRSQSVLQQELRGGPARRVTNLSLSIVGEDDVFPHEDAVSDNDGMKYDSDSGRAGRPWMLQLQEAMKGAMNPDADTDTEFGGSTGRPGSDAEEEVSGPRRRASRASMSGSDRRGSLDIGDGSAREQRGASQGDLDSAIDAIAVLDDADAAAFEADPELPEENRWEIARRPKEACMVTKLIKGKRVDVEGDDAGSMQTGVRLQASIPSMMGMAKYSLDCAERIASEKGAAVAGEAASVPAVKHGKSDVDLDELTTKLVAGTYIVNVRILSIQDLVEPELPGLYGAHEPDPVRDVQEGHEQRAAVRESLQAVQEGRPMDDDGEPSTPVGPTAAMGDERHDEEEKAKFAPPTGRLMKPLLRVVTPQDESIVRPSGRPEFVPMPWYQRAVRRFTREFRLHKRRALDDDKRETSAQKSAAEGSHKGDGEGEGSQQLAIIRPHGTGSGGALQSLMPTIPSRLWFLHDLGGKPTADARPTSWPLGFSRKMVLKNISIDLRRKSAVRLEVFDEAPEVRLGMAKIEARQRRARRDAKRKAAEAAAEAARRGDLDPKLAARLAAMVRRADEEEEEAEVDADNFTGLGAPIGYIDLPFEWLLLREMASRESGSKGGKQEHEEVWVGLMPSPLTFNRAQGGNRSGTGSIAPSGCAGFVRIQVDVEGPLQQERAEDRGEVAAQGAQGGTVHRGSVNSFALVTTPSSGAGSRFGGLSGAATPGGTIVGASSERDVLAAGLQEVGPSRAVGPEADVGASAETADLAQRAADLQSKAESIVKEAKAKAKAAGKPEGSIETPPEAARAYAEAESLRAEMLGGRPLSRSYADMLDQDGGEMDARAAIGLLGGASDEAELKRGLRRAARQQARALLQEKVTQASLHHSFSRWVNVLMPATVQPKLHWLVVGIHRVIDIPAMNSSVLVGQKTDLYVRVKCGGSVYQTSVNVIQGQPPLQAELNEQVRIPVWFPLPTFGQAQQLLTNRARSVAGDLAEDVAKHLRQPPFRQGQLPWDFRDQGEEGSCTYGRLSVGLFDHESGSDDQCIGFCHLSVHDVVALQREQVRERKHRIVKDQRLQRREALGKMLQEEMNKGPSKTLARSGRAPFQAGTASSAAKVGGSEGAAAASGGGAVSSATEESGAAGSGPASGAGEMPDVAAGPQPRRKSAADRGEAASAGTEEQSDDASSIKTDATSGTAGGAARRRDPEAGTGLGPAWVAMYGSPSVSGGLFSKQDGRSRAMETDPRVAVQYRGMVLLSARVEGPEMEEPADVYVSEAEAEGREESDDIDLHAAQAGMVDHIDQMQQSACSRIISQKEHNRVAREEAAQLAEQTRMEEVMRRDAERRGRPKVDLAGMFKKGATAMSGVGKDFGRGFKNIGSDLARGLQRIPGLGSTEDRAKAAVASVELMPSYRRIMPAFPVERLSQFFTRYSIVSLIVSGTELPNRENLRVKVSCGQIEMHTQYENVIGGMAYWQTQLSRKRVVLPRNPSQIPDIIVALETRAGMELGHVRIPAPTLLGQKWRTKPTWFHLVPNPLGIKGFKKGKYWRGHSGSLLLLLGMGKLNRTVPQEVWNHKLLGEGRIPPDRVAAKVNHGRVSAWRRQIKLIREFRKSRDSRKDLETVAFARVRHLVRLSDAAQESQTGSRLARVVLPNKQVVLYAVPETEGKRRATEQERVEDLGRSAPKSALASSGKKGGKGKRRVGFVGIGRARKPEEEAEKGAAGDQADSAEHAESKAESGDDEPSTSTSKPSAAISPARGSSTTMEIRIDPRAPPTMDAVVAKKRFAEGLAPLDPEGYSGAESEEEGGRATKSMADGFARMFVERARKGQDQDPLLQYIDKEDPPAPELLDPTQYESWKSTYVTNERYYWIPLPRTITLEGGRRVRNEFSTEQLGWSSQINRLLAKDKPGGIESYQLRINVFSARHLPAADKGGTSDPYIVVIFGETRTETRVRMRDLHPVFNQSVAINAELPSHSLTPQVLLEVWDKDLLSAHDRLGSCRVPLDYAYLVDSSSLYEESKKEIQERGLEGSVDEEIDPNKSMPAPAWIPFVPEQAGNWRVGDGIGLLPSSSAMLETVRDPEEQASVETAAAAAGDSGHLSSHARQAIRTSFKDMLGTSDAVRRMRKREAMVSRFRAHVGGQSSDKGIAAAEHHEHPLLGLGDGGRGFAGMPSNPLELAVLHGNDHEANEAALATNAELAAAIRRRRRLAEQLLSAHQQVSFDLTPSESPLEAKRKRLRAKKKREKRQAKLRAIENRREAYEMDEEEAPAPMLRSASMPVSSSREAAPKRLQDAKAAGLPDDLEIDFEDATPRTRSRTVVPKQPKADRDIPQSSTMAIRASRNSHLLRIARHESTGMGAAAVASAKAPMGDGADHGKPQLERLTRELVRREEERLTTGHQKVDDPAVVAKLQRLRQLKRAAQRIMHNMQMGIVGNSFPARPEVLASMQLIPRIFKVDETNVDSQGRQLFVTKGIPIPIQPATTLLPSKRPVKALVVVLHARGVVMPDGAKAKAPTLQYALTNVPGAPKSVSLAKMPTADDAGIASGMLGLLQRLGKAVSAAAKKAAQSIGGGGAAGKGGRSIPGPRLTMAAAAGFSPAAASASSVTTKLDDLYVGRYYYCKKLELKSWLPLDDSDEFQKAKRRRDRGEAMTGTKSRAALIREIRERNRQKKLKGKRSKKSRRGASVNAARMAELEEEVDMASTQDPRKVRTHPWLARISPRLHLSLTTGGSQQQGSMFSMFGGEMAETLADASIPLPTDKIPYVKYSALKAAQAAKKALAVQQANATYSDRLGVPPPPADIGPSDKELEADVFESTEVTSSTTGEDMKRMLARATGLTGPEDEQNQADRKKASQKMTRSLSLLMSALPNVAAAMVQRWVRRRRRLRILAQAGKDADGLPAPGSGSVMDALLIPNVAQRRHALGLDKHGAAGADASDATNEKYRTRTYAELDEEERKRREAAGGKGGGGDKEASNGGSASRGGAASALDDMEHTTDHEKAELEANRMSDRVRNNWAVRAQAKRKDYPPYMKDRDALRFPLGIVLPLSPAVFRDFILFRRAEVVNTGSARPAGYQRAGIVRAYVKLLDENIRYERALTPEQKQAEMESILRGEGKPKNVTPMYKPISQRIQNILDLAAKPQMVKVRLYLLVARFPRDMFFPGVWETEDSRLVEAWRRNHAAKIVSKLSDQGQAAGGLLGGVRKQEKLDEDAFESQLQLWNEGGPKLTAPSVRKLQGLHRYGIRPQPGQSIEDAHRTLSGGGKGQSVSGGAAAAASGSGGGFRKSLSSGATAGVEMAPMSGDDIDDSVARKVSMAANNVDPNSKVGKMVQALAAGTLPEELGGDDNDFELEGTTASQLVPVVKVPGLPPVRALDYVYADELFPMAPYSPVRSSKRVVWRVHLGGKSIELKPRSSSLVVSGDPGLQSGFEESRGVGGWMNEDAAEVDVFECVELEVPMPSIGVLTVEAWSRGEEGYSPAQVRIARREKEARDNVDKPYSAFAPGFETTRRLRASSRRQNRLKKKRLAAMKKERRQVIREAMEVIQAQKELELATEGDDMDFSSSESSDDDDEEEEILVEEDVILDSDEEQEEIAAREQEHVEEEQKKAAAKHAAVSAADTSKALTKLVPGGQIASELMDLATDAVAGDIDGDDVKRRTVKQQLLGGFMVDLEQRWLHPAWHSLGQKFAHDTRMRVMPLETRTLRNANGHEVGSIQCWVDILQQQMAKKFPPLMVRPPPPMEMEVRVVVWRVRYLPELTPEREGPVPYFFRTWLHRRGIDYERASRLTRMQDGAERVRYPGEERSCTAVNLPAWEARDLFHAIDIAKGRHAKNDAAGTATRPSEDELGLDDFDAELEWAKREAEKRRQDYLARTAPPGTKAVQAKKKPGDPEIPENETPAQRRRRERRERQNRFIDARAQYAVPGAPQPYQGFFNWRMRMPMQYARWGRLEMPGPMMMEVCEALPENEPSNDRATSYKEVETEFRRKMTAAGTDSRNECWARRWRALGAGMLDISDLVKRASLRPMQRTRVVPERGHYGVQESQWPMAWLPLRTTRKPIAHLNEEDFEGDEELAQEEEAARARAAAAAAVTGGSKDQISKAASGGGGGGKGGLTVSERPEDLGDATKAGKGKLQATKKLGVRASTRHGGAPTEGHPIEVLLSVEIVPREYAENQTKEEGLIGPPGGGREAPNALPYLKDPQLIWQQIRARRPEKCCGGCCSIC